MKEKELLNILESQEKELIRLNEQILKLFRMLHQVISIQSKDNKLIFELIGKLPDHFASKDKLNVLSAALDCHKQELREYLSDKIPDLWPMKVTLYPEMENAEPLKPDFKELDHIQ
jgi:sulfite reductase alpha subunit-like flavoprotein